MNIKEAHAYAGTAQGLKAARAFMDRPRILENRLTLLYARMDALREKMAPGNLGNGMPRSSGHGDKTAVIALKMCDLEREAEETLHALSMARKKRREILQDLPDGDAGEALRLVYLENMVHFAAAEKMYVETRQFDRYLTKGLRQVAMRLAMDETCAGGEVVI